MNTTVQLMTYTYLLWLLFLRYVEIPSLLLLVSVKYVAARVSLYYTYMSSCSMSDTVRGFALLESYASSLEHIARRFSCARMGFLYYALPNTKEFFTLQCLPSYLL